MSLYVLLNVSASYNYSQPSEKLGFKIDVLVFWMLFSIQPSTGIVETVKNLLMLAGPHQIVRPHQESAQKSDDVDAKKQRTAVSIGRESFSLSLTTFKVIQSLLATVQIAQKNPVQCAIFQLYYT